MKKIIFIILLCLFSNNIQSDEIIAYNTFHPTLKLSEKLTDINELQCMTENIYYEASGESYKGKLAVGMVTFNRMIKKHTTACNIVYWQYKKTCQFSWVCSGGKHLQKIIDKSWKDCYEIANTILNHSYNKKDITRGATHYHASYINPYWADSSKMTAKIGHHIFYKLRY